MDRSSDVALDQAVRTIERWGLLTGASGTVANALLLGLYTVAQRDSAYQWMGPANDVIDALSSGATIPVALALLPVLGRDLDHPGISGSPRCWPWGRW